MISTSSIDKVLYVLYTVSIPHGRLTSLFKRIFALITICVISLITPFTSALANTIVAKPTQQYIIIIDAGSSGSRLHLFAYQRNANAIASLQKIQEIKQIRINPGLSDVATKPENITAYLNQLFTPIAPLLTAQEKQKTPVYLLGTAGFRVLDTTKQKILFTSIRSSLAEVLNAHGYSIQPHANVIYGRAEGLFAWLTVNYLMQDLNFFQEMPNNHLGVLDMGGASTQVIYLPKEAPQTDFSGFIYNQRLLLPYTKSYQGYGVNQAEITLQKIYGIKLDVCYPQKGHADFNACYKLIQDYLHNQAQTSVCGDRYGADVCNDLGSYQPSKQKVQFFGIGFYYTVFHVFHLVDQIASPGQLRQSATTYCAMSWQNILTNYSKRADDDTLSKNCLRAAWIYALLQGYGLQDQTPLIVTENIVGQSSDWPLGAAIYLLTQPNLPISLYEAV